METLECVFQYPFGVLREKGFPLRGRWHEDYFRNDGPIVLELGCGKGEYTVGLARRYPGKNFIGIDIKGARMWTGACQARDGQLTNVAFVRTNIEAGPTGYSAEVLSKSSEESIEINSSKSRKISSFLAAANFL